MKKYNILSTILFIIVASSIMTFSKVNQYNKFILSLDSNISQNDMTLLKSFLPETSDFKETKTTIRYFTAYNKNIKTDKLMPFAIVFFTKDLNCNLTGFSGPIDMIAAVKFDGTILKVHILSHHETPMYITKIDSFIDQFSNKNIYDNLELGKNIDGITYATITSNAIVQILNKSFEIISNEVEQIQKTTFQPKKIFPTNDAIILLLIFAIAATGFITKKTSIRWCSLIISFIYLGLIKAKMFSVVHIANICLLKFPSLGTNPTWYIFIGLIFLSLLTIGNIYCGSICPFGALQDILHKTFGRSKKKIKLKPSSSIDIKLRYVKYFILFACLILSFYLESSNVANVEVFIMLFSLNASLIGWLLIILMLLLNITYSRFWCKYLCPTGAFNGLVSRLSLVKMKMNKKTCTVCLRCKNICPTDAIFEKNDQLNIDYSECILCTKCMGSCPMESISLGGNK